MQRKDHDFDFSNVCSFDEDFSNRSRAYYWILNTSLIIANESRWAKLRTTHYRTTFIESIKAFETRRDFFDRQRILEELITSRYEESDNIVNFDENIEMLRSFSLVALSVENDVFEMHRLMQFATKKWLKQRQELKQWKETYIAIMANAFPSNK